MQKDKSKIAVYKKTFETLVDLGVNPASASMTTYDFDDEEYQTYVNSRLCVIKRGEDSLYRFKKVIKFEIEKIKLLNNK